MVVPKVWDLLSYFKDFCKTHGWKTSENEDWVQTGEEYHNFVWARVVHPSTFRRVAADRKCAVQEGLTYRVVDASYTAWLLSQTPTEDFMQTILNNPELSKRTAIYDLSLAYYGKPICRKLNETDSQVFQEFEKFLEERMGVEVISVHEQALSKT